MKSKEKGMTVYRANNSSNKQSKGHRIAVWKQSALLFLSLSPHGMEDIPSYMKTEIDKICKKSQGHGKIMIVDCHNAMGEEISNEDGEDMLKAAKSCLDSLITKDSFPIALGYANTEDMDVWTEDLGMGGLGNGLPYD